MSKSSKVLKLTAACRAGRQKIPFMKDIFTLPASSKERPALLGTKCMACGDVFFPKRGSCPDCGTPDHIKEIRLSSRGILDSFTITRSSGEEGASPRVSGYVLLPEGLRVSSVITGWGDKEENLKTGMRVELVLEKVGEDEDGNELIGYKFRPLAKKAKKTAESGKSEVMPEGKKPKAKKRKQGLKAP